LSLGQDRDNGQTTSAVILFQCKINVKCKSVKDRLHEAAFLWHYEHNEEIISFQRMHDNYAALIFSKGEVIFICAKNDQDGTDTLFRKVTTKLPFTQATHALVSINQNESLIVF